MISYKDQIAKLSGKIDELQAALIVKKEAVIEGVIAGHENGGAAEIAQLEDQLELARESMAHVQAKIDSGMKQFESGEVERAAKELAGIDKDGWKQLLEGVAETEALITLLEAIQNKVARRATLVGRYDLPSQSDFASCAGAFCQMVAPLRNLLGRIHFQSAMTPHGAATRLQEAKKLPDPGYSK